MRLDDAGDLFDPEDEDQVYPGRLPPGAMWTGIELLDSNADGLQATDVLLVAGPPGVGVTSLLLTFARSLSMSNASRTLFASASASVGRISGRLLVAESGVLEPNATTGPLDDRSQRRRRQARERLARAPLTIATDLVDRRGLLNVAGSGRFDTVIVDDLSAFDAMSPRPGRRGGRVAETGHARHILRDLKAVALRTPIAVIAGVSLPAHGIKEPVRLTHLKEPGLLDAAETVLTLWRHSDEPSLLEARILKNRKGPNDVSGRLAIFADRGNVANLARRDNDALA